MTIIIINGRGGSGKDTFVEDFIQCAGQDHVLNISTVDYIKEIATKLGWNKEKDDLSRKYLSDLKDIATYWGDIPFKDVTQKANAFYQQLQQYGVEDTGFVFIHCREPHEIARLVDGLSIHYPVVTLLIRRPGGKIYGNHADDEIENYQYDFIVENNSTLDDLAQSAEEFYKIFIN